MLSYETINLNDYVRTGEGGTAVSYKHKTRDTLAKLYNPGFEADRAVEEFLTARTVYEMGVPTPKPYRLVTDGERFGGEYEFIPGKRSFARIISEETWKRYSALSCFMLWVMVHKIPKSHSGTQ